MDGATVAHALDETIWRLVIVPQALHSTSSTRRRYAVSKTYRGSRTSGIR